MSSRILVSYRHDDTGDYARPVYDWLAARFGADRILMGVTNIPPGVDLVDHINTVVSGCDAVVVLIGDRWLAGPDQRSRPFLFDPADRVRLEIAAALRQPNIRIIPVLVRGTAMPHVDAVPHSMTALTRRNPIRLSDQTFQQDISHLITALEAIVGVPAGQPIQQQVPVDRPSTGASTPHHPAGQPYGGHGRQVLRRSWLWAVVAILVVAAVGAGYLIVRDDGGDSGGGSIDNTPAPVAPQPYLPTPSGRALQQAERGVSRNADWTPVGRIVDDVEMVLVPAGCFTMGSTDQHIDHAIELCEADRGQGVCDSLRRSEAHEQPAHEICFEEPFWIDRYEVSNAQFERLEGQAEERSRWTHAERPRHNVTWYEARNFCELRNMRLPTEAEWAFAARGPDNLVFPWGNSFVAENVVFDDSPEYGVVAVGSRPNGDSWVSAYDMSGNVGEWVSSFFWSYPYDPNDGRENITGSDDRVVRGGSYLYGSWLVRAATRTNARPDVNPKSFGFRCAQSY